MKRKACRELILKVLTDIAIRRRAEQIWEERGKPDRIDQEIWEQAEQEISNPPPPKVWGRPVNTSLKFVKEKPVGKDPHNSIELSKTDVFADGKRWYYCKYCEGWVEGEPWHESEDTIGPLCGRRGHSEVCKRCDNEISFFGMVS